MVREKRVEDECFGLPRGGAIFGLFIGVVIILWGLTQIPGLLPEDFEFGWLVIVAFGLLIIAGAVYKLARR
ncbi:hypothetical protein KAH85_00775 [Candidatus Bathyarchaeota archaeon]|nr:hypothetical protein [Candidatus Bathyarchaeota archaeon]MCK5631071.1 hypothetical protein [Candidatus Bathyarchaeota archaeon]